MIGDGVISTQKEKKRDNSGVFERLQKPQPRKDKSAPAKPQAQP